MLAGLCQSTRVPPAPLATIVIPTHKRLAMLEVAVASARAQTIQDIEIIISIDGEDPETAAWAEGIEDPRVTIAWDRVQRGEAGNTVRGIEASSARFFGILHDDDQWEPNLLEKLLPPLEADQSVAVAFADHFVMDAAGTIDMQFSLENSHLYGRDVLTPGKHVRFYREALVQRMIPAVMTSVYRRSLVSFADMPPLPANFDFWLAWAAIRGDCAVFYVNERLSRYRVHGGSGTSRAKRAWAEAAVVIDGHLLSEPELISIHAELRSRLSSSYRRLANLKRVAGERDALRTAWRGVLMRATPKSVAGVVLLLTPRRISL